MTYRNFTFPFRQRGASAVEFAFIVVIFLSLLFGIVEFGRLFFNINSAQEITRRAAREQVVRWVTKADQDAIRCQAVLHASTCGTPAYFPGAIDISNEHVQLSFYNCYPGDEKCIPMASLPKSSQDNVYNCLIGDPNCIRFVRATLSDAEFTVLAPFLPFVGNLVPLPPSTVIMPAEALGLL